MSTSVMGAASDLVGSSLRLTNVLGNGYSLINSVGDVTLYGPAGSPRIAMTHVGSPGWTEQLSVGNNVFTISGVPVGGGTAVPIHLVGNTTVTGDLTASGTVTGSGLVFSVTNITFATNAWFATNDPDGNALASKVYISTNLVSGNLINYATNVQTATVDMSIPYGDVDVAGGITFAGLSNTKDTAYQTAVVFVKNTTGVVAPIDISGVTWTNTAGALRVTNYTICTIFRNPGRFTNIVTLPVW